MDMDMLDSIMCDISRVSGKPSLTWRLLDISLRLMSAPKKDRHTLRGDCCVLSNVVTEQLEAGSFESQTHRLHRVAATCAAYHADHAHQLQALREPLQQHVWDRACPPPVCFCHRSFLECNVE